MGVAVGGFHISLFASVADGILIAFNVIMVYCIVFWIISLSDHGLPANCKLCVACKSTTETCQCRRCRGASKELEGEASPFAIFISNIPHRLKVVTVARRLACHYTLCSVYCVLSVFMSTNDFNNIFTVPSHE